MRARDANRRVRIVPNQMPGLRERVGLSKAEVDRVVWAITRDGERYAGAAAINRAVRELPRWRWATALYSVPIIKALEEGIYRWVAAHRHWFSRWGTLPECARPGVPCVSEGE